VAVLGAGMMGAGIAFLSARRGYDVVLKDVRQEALDKGMAHCRDEAAKLKGTDEAGREAVLSRIRPTLSAGDLAGADLVVEAVIEDLDLKHRVTREAAPLLAPDAVWASNTSAIPITDLATAFADPARFLGLHFFSPVEQMPLLEVVRARATSDDTVARALAYCKALKKLPIVVNDRYGFYTTRVFSAYILEGAELVLGGHDPVLIEWAARTAGMVVPPLQVFDEVTLTLGRHVLAQSKRYLGEADLPGADLIRRMVDDLDRPGRASGRGFYDYAEGRRAGIWPGLRDLARGRPADADTGVEPLARRLMLVQAAEAARALEDGILRCPADADVGAVFGLGFAPNTGGPLSWIDRQGASRVVAWMEDLAGRIGPRYSPTPGLRKMASSGGRFYPS
jgi:3-hydroxyacyl-CoA dehydrogenase/enoyl-CoA hydratase/3-hydroxybutyryl-CoA epimerase